MPKPDRPDLFGLHKDDLSPFGPHKDDHEDNLMEMISGR